MSADPCDRHPAGGLAPTRDDLAEAFRIDSGLSRTQLRAEAVVVDREAITVLCSEDTDDGPEHTLLVALAHDGSVRGERRYAPEYGVGRAIAPIAGGGLLVAGEARTDTLRYAAQALRLDAHGAVTAQRRFGAGAVSGLAAAAALADGSTVVGGARDGEGWLMVLDRDLRARWEVGLTSTQEVVGLTALGDGFALVAVQERSTTTVGTTRAAAYGSDGSERWRLAPKCAGEPAAVAASADGSLVVVGHVDQGAVVRLWTLSIDLSGHVEWERRLEVNGDGCRGRAVAVMPDGGFAVAGDARRGESRGGYVAWLQHDGTVVREREFESREGRDEVIRGLAADGDGDLVVAGVQTTTTSGEAHAQLRRLDPMGGLRWERVYGG